MLTRDEHLAQVLAEVSEQLARADVAALETQGRFIESRYGEQRVANEDAPST